MVKILFSFRLKVKFELSEKKFWACPSLFSEEKAAIDTRNTFFLINASKNTLLQLNEKWRNRTGTCCHGTQSFSPEVKKKPLVCVSTNSRQIDFRKKMS